MTWPHELFVAPRPYSFELNEDMLKLIRDEFDVDKLTTKFADTIASEQTGDIEKIGKEIFENYGKNWMSKTIQLGEEYPDRTYEVLKEAVDHTGEMFFPFVPQRFIEIAYLSTQDFLILPIVESTSQRFVYKLVKCSVFNMLKQKCGDDVAKLLPCRYACLAACETLYKDLNLDIIVEMEATMIEDGYCQFAARKA